MRRTIMTAVATVSLAAPSVALAHHGGRHHGHHHHRHHHRHAHVLAFHAQAPAGSTTGTSSPAASGAAGTIASFTNGVLTITLADGSTVSGKVDERTLIKCPFSTPAHAADFGGRGHGDEDDQNEDDDRFEDNGRHDGPGDCPGHGESSHDAAAHCSSAALVPGASVREAFLAVSGQGAVWVRVDL